jgi:hypothetical protein
MHELHFCLLKSKVSLSRAHPATPFHKVTSFASNFGVRFRVRVSFSFSFRRILVKLADPGLESNEFQRSRKLKDQRDSDKDYHAGFCTYFQRGLRVAGEVR